MPFPLVLVGGITLGEALAGTAFVGSAVGSGIVVGNALSQPSTTPPSSTSQEQAKQGAQALNPADQGVCGANCMAAEKAPGKPTENDKFKPKKNWDGKKVAAPNGGGYGYPDENGNVWVPTGPDGSPAAHGGEHWDVQSPGGGYTNVYPGGLVRGGRAPFPVLP